MKTTLTGKLVLQENYSYKKTALTGKLLLQECCSYRKDKLGTSAWTDMDNFTDAAVWAVANVFFVCFIVVNIFVRCLTQTKVKLKEKHE